MDEPQDTPELPLVPARIVDPRFGTFYVSTGGDLTYCDGFHAFHEDGWGMDVQCEVERHEIVDGVLPQRIQMTLGRLDKELRKKMAATVLHRVLPELPREPGGPFPQELAIFEDGTCVFSFEMREVFVEVAPDGSMRHRPDMY